MFSVNEALHRLLAFMDDLLFPQDVLCLCCDQALGDQGQDGLCPACVKELKRLNEEQEAREEAVNPQELPEGIDYVHSAFPYEGAAKRLLHQLKFHHVRAAAVPLAKPMAYLSSGEEEIIVPVPTDERRRRKRGYNQATLLAQHLAKELGMPVCEALSRTQQRAMQTGLSLEERRKNLIGCMKASDAVNGKRILLVDDVYTSGSTAAEAARALYAAGCKSVGVFTAARAGINSKANSEPFPIAKLDEK